MRLAWNKATVIESRFLYPQQKSVLITLHVLLFNELLNTTLWVAVELSVLHSSKKCGWPAFKFRMPVLRERGDHVGTHDSVPSLGPSSDLESDLYSHPR